MGDFWAISCSLLSGRTRRDLPCQIKQAPQRIGEIAGAVMLFGCGWREAHFRTPEVPDRAAGFLENVTAVAAAVLVASSGA